MLAGISVEKEKLYSFLKKGSCKRQQ